LITFEPVIIHKSNQSNIKVITKSNHLKPYISRKVIKVIIFAYRKGFLSHTQPGPTDYFGDYFRIKPITFAGFQGSLLTRGVSTVVLSVNLTAKRVAFSKMISGVRVFTGSLAPQWADQTNWGLVWSAQNKKKGVKFMILFLNEKADSLSAAFTPDGREDRSEYRKFKILIEGHLAQATVRLQYLLPGDDFWTSEGVFNHPGVYTMTFPRKAKIRAKIVGSRPETRPEEYSGITVEIEPVTPFFEQIGCKLDNFFNK
jgi:hypothetical protein